MAAPGARLWLLLLSAKEGLAFNRAHAADSQVDGFCFLVA